MQTNRSWSIDDKRYNFQFGCEIGWEIKAGKRVRMVKNPSYTDAEEPLLQRHHNGILEFAGCDLLSRRVDSVGNSELREGSAAASDGNGTWCGAVALPRDQGRIGV